MNDLTSKKNVTLVRSLIPIVGLMLLIIFGVIVMPQVLSKTIEVTDAYGQIKMIKEQGPSMSLELVFILASVISVINLFTMGYSWEEIQQFIVKKVTQLIPAAMILFAIGIIIGSWVFSGTIPMLVYFGVELISPNFIYLVAFLVPSIFSILTGTSWGSAGTIGVVIMGIAGVIGANLPIVAAAVIGGAYFGDKLSPLSDTTNIAALSVNIPLMDHVRSMLNTTLPAYILASITYFIIGLKVGIKQETGQLNNITELKVALSQLFQFDNIFQIVLIIIPIIIVLFGSIKKKPVVPTLILSSIIAAFIGVFVQGFTMSNMFTALYSGFDASSFFTNTEVNESIESIVNRGGLNSMTGPVVISIMVFIFVGTLDCIKAIPFLVNKALAKINTRSQTIISSQIVSGVTNGLTSNQYATSYIVAEAFKTKYDQLKIPRKVLSRSIEDFGTMLESLLPWTTTGIYMFSVLGISPMEYWKFQFLSLYGFAIAILLAITGIGCFYKEKQLSNKSENGMEIKSER